MNVHRFLGSDFTMEDLVAPGTESFFASTGFADLWHTVGGKTVYWVAESGDTVVAFFPGVEFGSAPVRRFQAMPSGCYANLFFNTDDPAVRSRSVKSLMDSVAAARYVKVYLNDYYRSFDHHEAYLTEMCQCRLVDVTNPEWQPPDGELRREIRKAVRERIEIERFDAGKHFDGFLKLVRLSEERLRRKCNYSPAFFRALARLAETDGRVRWVWCEHQHRPVASHIMVVEGDCLLGWQQYYDREYSFLHPNKYIPFALARQASREGVPYLNLGATPADAKGVAAYKDKWGGRDYQYPCFYRKNWLGKLF